MARTDDSSRRAREDGRIRREWRGTMSLVADAVAAAVALLKVAATTRLATAWLLRGSLLLGWASITHIVVPLEPWQQDRNEPFPYVVLQVGQTFVGMR